MQSTERLNQIKTQIEVNGRIDHLNKVVNGIKTDINSIKDEIKDQIDGAKDLVLSLIHI